MTRTTATTYTDEFGSYTDEVARFLSAIETLTADQLTRAEAESDTDDEAWENAWHGAKLVAAWRGLEHEFDAAIDAAWEHAARHPQFERWDHVWEHAVSHTAAALVLSDRLNPLMFNRLTSAFIAVGVITAATVPPSWEV
jgi:hypothetical protein